MHPAKSVIFFTTASGAGYGILVWLAAFTLGAGLPQGPAFAVAAFAISLGLVTAGLLASTFHLGHPERAWRALSQWRSSWLSREGVAAIFTYLPAGLFAAGALAGGFGHPATAAAGLAAAACATATVIATAMIYASLRAVPAWSGWITVAGYLAFAALSGAVVMQALLAAWGAGAATVAGACVIALAFTAFAIKLVQWRRVDEGTAESGAGSATGLGRFGTVRLLEAPHTAPNYLMKEMGYVIARRHARALRRAVVILAFFAPAGLSVIAIASGGVVAGAVAVVAAVGCLAGVAVERWLFFAEARHVVTLYYGQASGGR